MTDAGSPDTYGYTADGHCGHCNANPDCHAISAFGVFCLACCRWIRYVGPAQVWGDGMGHGRAKARLFAARTVAEAEEA